MPPDTSPMLHVAFAVPARVMLMDKSTPLVAVTGQLDNDPSHLSYDHPSNMIIKARWLFPANAAPIKTSMRILINRAHVVSIVEVKDPA